MDREQVIDKILKLREHAKSAREIGSMAEAETAAAKANELLTKYKISQAEVEESKRDEDDPIQHEVWIPEQHGIEFRRQRVEWMETLAKVVAKANFCDILVHRRSNWYTFVGRDSDREVAMYLFGFLARQIEEHCEREYNRKYQKIYRNGGDTSVMKGWKRSFRQAAIVSLHQRFEEMRQSVMHDADEQQSAMVRKEDARVQEAVKELGAGKADTLSSKPGTNLDGAKAGSKFGEDVPINRGVEGYEEDTEKITS